MAKPVTVKHKIDEAAIKLFACKGIAATTIKEIAKLGGVAEGALYRHYTSKLDMGWDLYCHEIQKFLTHFVPFLKDESLPFEDRFRFAWRYLYDYYQEYPDSFVFIMYAQHDFPDRTITDENKNPFYVVKNFIKAGIIDGSFKPQAPEMAAAIIIGLSLQPLTFNTYKLLCKDIDYIRDAVITAALKVLTG